jgi:hypothetical protein
MEIFKRQGDPMAVALRYRQTGRSLTIGWELIGPELFPAYLLLLSFNLVITAVVTVTYQLITHGPITFQIFLVPFLAQIVCVTLVFILLNALKGVFKRKFSEAWMWPPADLAHLLPLPRWYSASGFVACGVLTLWWLAIPHFPRVLLGSAAPELKFSPAWHSYYAPILLLLVAGAGQRAVNVIRPDWNWLLPIARFAVDGAGACVMFFFRTHTLVLATEGTADPVHTMHLAQIVNARLVWGLFGPWLWIYLGITSLVYGWYSLPYLRRYIRRHRSAVRHTGETNVII